MLRVFVMQVKQVSTWHCTGVTSTNWDGGWCSSLLGPRRLCYLWASTSLNCHNVLDPSLRSFFRYRVCEHDFCRAMLCISTAYAVVLCPPVCLTRSCRHSVETTKRIFQFFSLSDSHTICSFSVPNVTAIIRRGPSNYRDFRPISCFGIDDCWSVSSALQRWGVCYHACMRFA